MIGPQVIKWVGGEHPFALYLGELRALQGACDAGPEQILTRIRTGQWRLDDMMEVIRQGLIGGGMAPEKAARMVTLLFEQHPLLAFKATALEVLMLALTGPEDDQPGKAEGDAAPPESGPSAPSTETVPRSE